MDTTDSSGSENNFWDKPINSEKTGDTEQSINHKTQTNYNTCFLSQRKFKFLSLQWKVGKWHNLKFCCQLNAASDPIASMQIMSPVGSWNPQGLLKATAVKTTSRLSLSSRGDSQQRQLWAPELWGHSGAKTIRSALIQAWAELLAEAAAI